MVIFWETKSFSDDIGARFRKFRSNLWPLRLDKLIGASRNDGLTEGT